MKTIAQKQEELADELRDLGDSFDQYSYLITLACQVPDWPEAEKTRDRLVKGCQSRVWLKAEFPDGRLALSADSSTMIIKGILKLLMDLLSGHTAQEVAQTEITFLQDTELMDTFETSRQKGIGYILRVIRDKAAAAAEEAGGNALPEQD